FVLFFFFSSRRRHTRFSRDWSSDVCSSDLPEIRLRGLAVHTDEHDVQVLVHRLDSPGQDSGLTLLRQRLGDALLRDGMRQLDEALVQFAIISHMPYASTCASSSRRTEAPSTTTFPATSSPAPRPHRRSRDADQECSRTTATRTQRPSCAPTQRPPCWRPPGSPGLACFPPTRRRSHGSGKSAAPTPGARAAQP